MDVRKMNLIDAPVQSVTAAQADEYFLGAECMSEVDKMLATFEDTDLWDPKFQAWLPLLKIYLTRGCNPDMTLEYANSILHKRNYMFPETHELSSYFASITQLKSSSEIEPFEAMSWNQIELFCEEQCRFFIQGRKTIPAQLHETGLYVSTMKSLLDYNTWQGNMSALNLYRHCQVQGFSPPPDQVAELQSRMGEWLYTYLETFEYLQDFVSGSQQYDWYCEKVKAIVTRVWKTCLLLTDRPVLYTPDDMYAMPPTLADNVIEWVANCPAVFDNPYAPQTVWDALCQLYFARNPTSDDFLLKAYFCLCIPKSYILRMLDTLYDFYWCVKDKRLPILLCDRKTESYQNGLDTRISPEEYRRLLASRGFPFT